MFCKPSTNCLGCHWILLCRRKEVTTQGIFNIPSNHHAPISTPISPIIPLLNHDHVWCYTSWANTIPIIISILISIIIIIPLPSLIIITITTPITNINIASCYNTHLLTNEQHTNQLAHILNIRPHFPKKHMIRREFKEDNTVNVKWPDTKSDDTHINL